MLRDCSDAVETLVIVILAQAESRGCARLTGFPSARTRDKKVGDNLHLVLDGHSKIASQFIGWTEVTPDFHEVP